MLAVILVIMIGTLRSIGTGGQATTPTMTVDTIPGVVLGTVGYMSPEQVRGLAADARSGIFALGVLLYEMLSGQRAFKGQTPADTMSAILKEDPPELAEAGREISPAVERIVRHCLEKNPEERFRSARDVAFALENVSHTSQSRGGNPAAVLAPQEAPARPRAWPAVSVGRK